MRRSCAGSTLRRLAALRLGVLRARSRAMQRATMSAETLILPRAAIAGRVRPIDYIDAVEGAFRALAAGQVESIAAGHVPGEGGAFHVKSAVARSGTHRAAIKINGNFPGNPRSN